MNKPRTYWHLQDLKHKPRDYDIVTSRLLYSTGREPEVNMPITAWRERYLKGSPLLIDDWERFRDPRETIYTSYTELQNTKEIFVDGLMTLAAATGYDQRLSAAWVEVLERCITPIRYPMHGLQMVTAYIGQLAPGGRIVITSLFQAADEMRRIQRFAQRMRQLQELHPSFGAQSRGAWETDALWQPLRRVIERLLVTYDWGEAFVALNLCLKPAFDRLFMERFAALARNCGDELMAGVLYSLNEDCRWHRAWSTAMIRLTLDDRPDNQSVIEAWLATWDPAVATALQAFGPIFEEAPEPQAFDRVWDDVVSNIHQERSEIGIVGLRL